jgi:integrase
VHLVPALGAVPLAKLAPVRIQAAHTGALTSGRQQPKTDGPKGLSAQTVMHHHRVLSKSLKRAVRLGLIAIRLSASIRPDRHVWK